MHKTVLANMNSYKLWEQKIQIYKMPFLDLFLMLSAAYYQTNATLAEQKGFLLAWASKFTEQASGGLGGAAC